MSFSDVSVRCFKGGDWLLSLGESTGWGEVQRSTSGVPCEFLQMFVFKIQLFFSPMLHVLLGLAAQTCLPAALNFIQCHRANTIKKRLEIELIFHF